MEMEKCPLCGSMPKLTAYREGVWVDVSCCNGYKFSSRSIQEAIKHWNKHVQSTIVSEIYDELYVTVQLMLTDKQLAGHGKNLQILLDRLKGKYQTQRPQKCF